MTTKKNNTVVAPNATNTTRKPVDEILHTGVQSIDSAIDFLQVNFAKTSYSAITADNLTIAQYCYIQLETALNNALSQKSTLEKKISSEKTSDAEKQVASEKLIVVQETITQLQAMIEALPIRKEEFNQNISVYMYGTGDSVLHVHNSTMQDLDKDLTEIRLFGNKFYDTLLLFCSGKEQPDSKKMLKNLKNSMQHAVELLIGNTYHVNNNDMVKICTKLLSYDVKKNVNGNITKDSGVKVCRKETLLRAICAVCAEKLVNREVGLVRKAEQALLENIAISAETEVK